MQHSIKKGSENNTMFPNNFGYGSQATGSENNNAEMSSGRLVNIFHLNESSKRIQMYINVDDLLISVRDTLQKGGIMKTIDHFYAPIGVRSVQGEPTAIGNSIPIDKNRESEEKLKTILTLNSELYIGHEVTDSYTTIVDKNLRGYTIENDKDVLDCTSFRVCTLAEYYTPSTSDVDTTSKLESFHSFSKSIHRRQCKGMDSVSISLTTPWASGGIESSHSVSKSESTERKTSFAATRMVYEKLKVAIDPNKLIIDEDFHDKLEMGLRGNRRSIEGYTNVVETLNKYGWYVPIEYTLGGAAYTTKESQVNNEEEAIEEKMSLELKTSAVFNGFGASTGNKHTSDNSSSTTSEEGTERDTFNQIVGNATSRVEDMPSLLANTNNWRIIRYKKLYPTLMLLLNNNDNETLSICLNLLRKFHTYSTVRSLQSKIDVGDYESKIEFQVNPVFP